MEWKQIFGLVLIAYGIATFVARFRAPGVFWKLKPMQQWWGKGPGTALHVFAYSVLPILMGIGMVLKIGE